MAQPVLSTPATGAAQEYAFRLSLRESRVKDADRTALRLGNLRIAIVVSAAALAWLIWGGEALSAWWLLAPAAAFFVLGAFLDRSLRDRDCAQRAVEFYRGGLARIEDRWIGTGEQGERFRDPQHPYCEDLDLFGRGSVFELISTARTRMGEERLAGWLLKPASSSVIQARQQAITELQDRIDLREDLALAGESARVGVHPEQLLKWAESPPELRARWLPWLALALAAAFFASVVIWGLYDLASPCVAVFLAEYALQRRLRSRLNAVSHGAEHALADLSLLSAILARLERERFQSPALTALGERLIWHNLPASRAIARLSTIGDLVDSQHNLLVQLLNTPLMYSLQVACAAERWRSKHGASVRGGIEVVAEAESLLSLAGYTYEHASDVFPEFVPGSPASFNAEDLAHPLIPQSRAIRNDVQIAGQTRILLVSGSNMSGKSTLLRAIGVNIVLAMAGAPVRARRIRLSALQVGASIRVNDSLQQGTSRFYTEIKRLRALVDLAGGELALFFLLDELLQGTNSADRRVGAEGLLRELAGKGAMGLVTTHDLALAEMAAALEGHIRNVHFQDYLEDGKMRFDYKLRDGVVAKSNGLELMRSIGLQV
jgi:hypothetical protein